MVVKTSINYFKLAYFSLGFLWFFTALSSAIWSVEFGFNTLSAVGVTGPIASIAVYGGALLDLLIGLWVFSRKKIALCCLVQLIVIVIFTLLLSVISAQYWLHPFGPVTKNLPILFLILLIYREEKPENN